MRILIVGGGGREHALAWKLSRDDPTADIVAAPGNPGIAKIGRCVDIQATDIERLVGYARVERIDLTIVGPEAPLALGIVDRFREAGLSIFGPTERAAQIETSKSFAKQLMLEAGVPTASAAIFTKASEAKAEARRLGAPVVVKASGIAAGKGVIVAESIEQADAAIDDIMESRIFGDAGSEVLVEEFMEGEEVSLFAFTDGSNVLPMLAAQDHKRIGEGDTGPNTGGMGAYAPVKIADQSFVNDVVEKVFTPTLKALRSRNATFTGLLYAGLMVTRDGPKVVEFNCRFGDPETQAILPLLASSLLVPIRAIAEGGTLRSIAPFGWHSQAAVTTVVAAEGYPDKARAGDVVTLPPDTDSVTIFHSGTKARPDGEIVTAGGRVVAVTAVAETIAEAQALSARTAEQVSFTGRQFRRDIGWRALKGTN